MDLDEYEVEELRQQDRFERRAHFSRCQCDESWGTCPGPINCPHSGVEEE